jgi:hypothetical protein
VDVGGDDRVVLEFRGAGPIELRHARAFAVRPSMWRRRRARKAPDPFARKRCDLGIGGLIALGFKAELPYARLMS